jgi:hypothetical protein
VLYRAAKQRFDEEDDFKTRAREAVTELQGGRPEYLQVGGWVGVAGRTWLYESWLLPLDPGWRYKRLACCLPSFCPAPACPPARLQAWQRICNASRVEFQKIYDRLGVQLEGGWDGVGWGVVQLAVGHSRSWRGSVAGSAALILPATCHPPAAGCSRVIACGAQRQSAACTFLMLRLPAAPACCACRAWRELLQPHAQAR